jgi:mRNA interferase MazF
MPKGKLTYRRGDIYWVEMNPTVGAEVQKTRSCLILQNDTMNQYGEVTIVLPFRPGSKQAPYAVNVQASLETRSRSVFRCRSDPHSQLSEIAN